MWPSGGKRTASRASRTGSSDTPSGRAPVCLALTAASTVATGTVGVLLLIVGSRAVAAGTMTLGDMAMYVFLVGLLAAPIVQIAATAQELGKAAAGLGRVAELRALPDRGRGGPPAWPCHQRGGGSGFRERELRLRARAARPQGREPACTSRVHHGARGAQRLGKEHPLPAAPRLRPTRRSGRILVDARDLALMCRRDYRAHLGVVLQEDVLFDGTIADNIRYGRPGAALSDVYAAGRLAHCDEFVQRCPDGYATLVGERGVRLSAGQRQRVAIARAMLADPRILILDEATSSLDSESEILIQDALRTLCRGRTTFVIAHRLSTIRSADQILVLEAGTIVERGSHEELLAREGRYWRLHHAQQRGAVAAASEDRVMGLKRDGGIVVMEGRRKVPSVLGAGFTIFAVKLSLKLRGYGRTIRWIQRAVQGVPTDTSADAEVVKAAEHAVAMAGALYPGRALCLEQSLALYYLLRRQGVALAYCHGVRPHPFTAHAWVEYRQEPINDVAEHVELFARFPEQML